MQTFGSPPRADEIRALVAQRLKEVRELGGTRETVTVEWRGQRLHCDVIDMPIDMTYYNPGTRRIRAQRSYDPVRDDALKSDPWSETSQSYIDYLLKSLPADPSRRDPDFEELKESIRDFKQNNPGLITHEGVLVDGNTRRAALKELGVAYIRVGVLPESCTWADVSAVELSLQLRKEHKREYSYINRLLAIEEQIALGRPIEDIAREFRIRVATCHQDLWILKTLRDLIDRSRHGGVALRLMDFEEHQEKLRELHRAYMNAVRTNRENAELLKEIRLAAIALNFSKTDVRLVESDFRVRYLDRLLPESLRTQSKAAEQVAAIPGLNRMVKTGGSQVAEARELTDRILRAKAVEAAGQHSTVAQVTEASQTIAAAKKAFNEALAYAGKDARLRKRRRAAADRINDACDDIEQCITDVVLARSSNTLDEEGLDEALLRLHDVLAKLAVETARSVKAPGDGITWLLKIVSEES